MPKDTIPAVATSTPVSTVLMIGPDGSDEYIPYDKVAANQTNGAELGVRMVGPDGSKAVIPFSKQDANQKNGAKWDASPDNDATKDYATGGLLKQKYNLPRSVDLTQPYYNQADSKVIDPIAFSKAYEEFHASQPQPGLIQRTATGISNFFKPWEGAQAPRTPEELVSGAEMAGGEMAGEAAAPVLKRAGGDVGDALSRLRVNPFRTSKIEPVVAAQTAKAGLPAGEAAVSTAEAAQKTVQAAEAAKTATQANVDSALQDIAKQHAAQNGLPAPAAGTASRDVLASNGNALVDAGKADYKVLDKFTNGKFTNAQAELKNAQFELQQKAGTTDADVPTLEANVLRAQMNVDNLFDKAVESGMPKEIAEAARTKFRTGQATLDAANDVRMANKVRGAAGTRTTDLNALENRWTARYDAGRLQQAFGEQGAKDALAQVHAARVMGDTFDAMPATESQALRELIEENTTTGKFGAKTNWLKVRDAFSKLPNRAAQFADVPKVEKFINDQAFYQRMRVAGKVAAGTVAGGALTSEGWNLAH